MRFVLSATLFLAACGDHDGHDGPDGRAQGIGPWPVVPATRVRAVADASIIVAWDAELRADVADFNFGLTAPGCDPPFIMVFPSESADHDVVLVAGADPRLEIGLVGGETDGLAGQIVISGRPSANPLTSPLRGIIAHELGHAVGLGHADPTFGLSAMTSPPDSQLRARDVAAMACLLACGPCDPSADPYTSP